MLHTKFSGNRSAGAGEEDFLRVFFIAFLLLFTIYGCGSHLMHVTQMPQTNFRSPFPRRLHIKFGFGRASGFRKEDIALLVTTVGRPTTDGRRTMGIP